MSPRSIGAMSDAQLARRALELAYHLLECAIDPDHPTSRMNSGRWKIEAKQVEQALRRRGLLADDDPEIEGPEPDGYRQQLGGPTVQTSR